MTSGTSAPQVIVIHRRQIIVNQRISVDHFQRAGALEQPFRRRSESLADGEQQRGPKTLAAGKQTPANGLMDRDRLARLGRNQMVQLRVNQRATVRKKLF